MRRRALLILGVVLIVGVALFLHNRSSDKPPMPCNIATKVSAMVNGATINADC